MCVEINPTKGWCTWTISEKEQFVSETEKINDMTWWEQRPAMVLVPAMSWKEIKTAFIKICKKNGNCSADIAKWERKFQKVENGQ